MNPERDIVITDPDCPRGTVYRVSAEYAKRQAQWADQVPDGVVTVTIYHPSTDITDLPVFDSSWS